MMHSKDKILVLGSRGLVGSAIVRELKKLGYENLLTPVREELELLNQTQVLDYFTKHSPGHVFVAAAKVGGIHANNTYRADFILENLTVQQNVFNAALKIKVPNLLFLGSSCIYPKNCPQPIKEEYLLTSTLESTNEPYAIAKIAGLKCCESIRRQYGLNWISAMPTNLYGVNDNYHLENSHVIPGLIARFYQAMINKNAVFKVWGTGKPKREFLYVDDAAKACVFLMNYPDLNELPYYINIGTGEDLTIAEVANVIARIIGYTGEIVFDSTKPDGTERKCLDVSRLKSLGWKPEVGLEQGLVAAIEFYKNNMRNKA